MKEFSRRRLFELAGVISGSSLTRFVELQPRPVETRRQAPVVHHGDRSLPRIALTIDDAWLPQEVERVLDICEKSEVRMTLFPAARVVECQAPLWRRAVEFGHEIGNHTYSHRWLTQLSNQQILAEIDAAQNATNQVVGKEVKIKFLRPPGMAGFTRLPSDERIRSIVAERGLSLALWDIDSNSARFYGHIDAQGVYRTIIGSARNGSIVLQHFLPTDSHALPLVIDYLKKQGFELVTLTELLEKPQTLITPPPVRFD